MVLKNEIKSPGKGNSIKLAFASAVLLSVFFIDLFFGIQAWGWRLAYWLVSLSLAFGVLFTTTQASAFFDFAKLAQNEMRKVVWPQRPEIVQTSLVIAAVVLVLGFVLWGVDSVLLSLVGLLTGQRG